MQRHVESHGGIGYTGGSTSIACQEGRKEGSKQGPSLPKTSPEGNGKSPKG